MVRPATATGRLIPLTMVPLWDPELAAAEIRRCGRQGQLRHHLPGEPPSPGPAVDPRQEPLLGPGLRGLPGDRDGDLHAHRLVVEDAARPSPDAPFIISSTLTFQNAMGSLLRLHLLGHPCSGSRAHHRLLRGPGRLDALHPRAGRQALGGAQRQQLRHAGSETRRRRYIPGRVYGCIFDDATGLRTATSSAWTRSASRPTTRTPTRRSPTPGRPSPRSCAEAGLNDEEIYKLARGNAIKAFGLGRWGITK